MCEVHGLSGLDVHWGVWDLNLVAWNSELEDDPI